MPSKSSTRIAEPLLGGPVGIHLGAAGRRFASAQATALAAVLGITTFLALALQGPCLSSGYEQPSASARMCAGPLSTAFLGDTNPEVLGRAHGGAAALAPLEARLIDLFHLFTDDVSLFMVGVLLLNTAGIAALGAGLLALARFRGWLVAVFASPLILFTLGSTLDPLALALAVWAVVLFFGTPPLRPRGWFAGVLLGLATFINPLALLVLLALTLAGPNPARGLKSRNPRMMLAAATITSALLLVVDLTAIDRIIHWYSDVVDGGSFASILVMAELGETSVWAPLWIIVSAGVVLAVAVSLYMVRRTGLDPAVAACLLIGGCLLLAPGLMPWDSLWLLPFIALSIRRWWVLIVWTLAEAVFAVAIQLGDVTGFEADKGLDSTFVALFTLLRLLALILVVIMAGENLYRRGIRGATVTAVPPRRGGDDGAVDDRGQPSRRGDEPGNTATDGSNAGYADDQAVRRNEEYGFGHDSQRTGRLD